MRLVILSLIAAISLYSQEISHTTEPRVIHKVDPEYTSEALAAKTSGAVVLAFMIGADGVPSNIKLVRGLGLGLDEKAVECLQKWRFAAATRFSEPISTKATVEINFRLPRPPNSK